MTGAHQMKKVTMTTMTPCRATPRDIKLIVNSCCLHFDSFVSSPYTIHVFTIYLLLHLLLCCWNIGFTTVLVVICHISCFPQLKRYLSIAIDSTNCCEICFVLFSFLCIYLNQHHWLRQYSFLVLLPIVNKMITC